MPQDTCDPILAASALVQSVQQIVARQIDPQQGAVVSFGGIKSNSFVSNVIPANVQLVGTARTYLPALRNLVERRLGEICTGIGQAHGLNIEYTYDRGYSAVINDEPATKHVQNAVAAVAGATCVAAPQVLSGEDFFSYSQPGITTCFFFVGAGIDDGITRPHHSPEFDIDERSLEIGLNVFLELVKSQCQS